MHHIMKLYVLIILSAFLLSSCANTAGENINEKASVTINDQLAENPLSQLVITSSINENNHTMATLYGNEAALKHARDNGSENYPERAVLYQVTWKQKEDTVWFGAKIPEQILTVEKIDFYKDANAIKPRYTLYKGSPLVKKPVSDDTKRIDFIVHQKYAFVP